MNEKETNSGAEALKEPDFERKTSYEKRTGIWRARRLGRKPRKGAV